MRIGGHRVPIRNTDLLKRLLLFWLKEATCSQVLYQGFRVEGGDTAREKTLQKKF